MNRRRFAFWVGLGLFQVSRVLGAEKFDEAAATLMEWSEQNDQRSRRDRWRPNANRTWKWYERQTYLNGTWKQSGLTTPIHRRTGKALEGADGYLDDELVPESVKDATTRTWKKLSQGRSQPSPVFVDGLPPSKWLRSLNANEIRLWLRTILVPDVGVEQMSFWTHLTRDHAFLPDRIRGLTIPEQAKLHSAAHYGF